MLLLVPSRKVPCCVFPFAARMDGFCAGKVRENVTNGKVAFEVELK